MYHITYKPRQLESKTEDIGVNVVETHEPLRPTAHNA